MASQLSLTSFVWKNLLLRYLRTLLTLCGIGKANSVFDRPVSFSDAFDPRPFSPAFRRKPVLQTDEAPPHPIIPMRDGKVEA
jgi:hypothetical protein